MSLSQEQLSLIISQGEAKEIEFKSKIVSQHELAKVLTAFANTEGGCLIFGVDDNGMIVGLSEEATSIMEKKIQTVCKSLFSYGYDIGKILIEGKNVIYAKVEKAPRHLVPITINTGEYFVRRGDKNVQKSLLQKRSSLKGVGHLPSREIIGFVAMSFREEEDPSLIDYFYAMQRAVEKTKLPIKLHRIDLQDGDFEISQQLMNEIDKSDFVVADFTLSPHNVYFEVGYARGVKKEIIQTARKGETLQFDVRNWNTLFYRNATELEEKLASKLENIYKRITSK